MDIYAEEVMDHYEHPRNQGELKGEDVITGSHNNASCGDTAQFFLRVVNGEIQEVKWKGQGCAVSTAASSKLSEWLKGKNIEDVKNMTEEELMKQVGFEVGLGREKCLRLSSHVVKTMIL